MRSHLLVQMHYVERFSTLFGFELSVIIRSIILVTADSYIVEYYTHDIAAHVLDALPGSDQHFA